MTTGASICCAVLQAIQVQAIRQHMGSPTCGSIQRASSHFSMVERSCGCLEMYVVAPLASRRSKDIVGGSKTWSTLLLLSRLRIGSFALANAFDKTVSIEVWWWQSYSLRLSFA